MITDFFKPGNIFLVVGATNNREKYGSKVFLDLKGAGYNVIAINKNVARGDEIHGTPAYPSVTSFFDRIDILFDKRRRAAAVEKMVLLLVIPPKGALAVLKEAAALGIGKAWFQPGSESAEAVEFCKKHGIEVIHDQCIMVQKPPHQ